MGAQGKAAANPPVEIEPPHYGRNGRLPPGPQPQLGRVEITPRDVLREPRELVQEEDEGERIVGGTDATPGEFPFIISLQAWTSHFCGGSIYDEQTVVTAAHCIDGQSQDVLDNMYVVAGEQDLQFNEGSEQRIKVVNIVTINYSSRTMDNDIAIIHLESPFVFNQRVKPISPCSSEYSGAVTVAGWGATAEGGQGARTLQKVELQTVSGTTCNWSYGSITDNMVCAGVDAGGKDSCQGDSGGPLVTGQGTEGTCLLGVVSFGYGCQTRIPRRVRQGVSIRLMVESERGGRRWQRVSHHDPDNNCPGSVRWEMHGNRGGTMSVLVQLEL